MSVGKVRSIHSSTKESTTERYKRQQRELAQQAQALVAEVQNESDDSNFQPPENSGNWKNASDTVSKWPADISDNLRELCELWWAMGCNRFNRDYLKVSRASLAEKLFNKIGRDNDFWKIVDKKGRDYGQEILINMVQRFWKTLDDSHGWNQASLLVLQFLDEDWDQLLYEAELNISTKHLLESPTTIRTPVSENLARYERIAEKEKQRELERAQQRAEYDLIAVEPKDEEDVPPRRKSVSKDVISILDRAKARREAEAQLESAAQDDKEG